MSFLNQTLKTILASVLPSRLLVVRGDRSRKAIHLTFDDGPHPEHTPRLLEALRDLDARATFFVVGRQAAAHPDLARRIVAEGHALGNHSYFHREPSQTSAIELLAEVRQTRDLLRGLTRRDVNLFRPPKGKLSVAKLRILWRHNQTVALWNIDPRDFAMTDSNQLVGWSGSYRPSAGDIVLLHDNHPHAAAAVSTIVRRAAEFGLQCEPLLVSTENGGLKMADGPSEVPGQTECAASTSEVTP